MQLNITLFFDLRLFWPESNGNSFSYFASFTDIFLLAIIMEEFFFKIDIFFDKFSDLDIIGLLYSSSCSFSPNFYLMSGVITTPRLPKMLWELESLSELLAFSSSSGLSYREFLSFGLWIMIFPSILLASISSNLDRLGFLRSVA